jgi:sec-independent protein translocase protein TatB
MGWMELMLIGVVALIVVGPKDLPVMFQALGKMSAKVRRMAREFSSAMNEAANATGAADIAKDLKGMTSSKGLGMDALRDAADKFDKWEPGKERPVMGSETAKLQAERAEAARKIREATAQREEEKRAAAVAEAADDIANLTEDNPAPAPPASEPSIEAPKTTRDSA